jgi:hypothetical protein
MRIAPLKTFLHGGGDIILLFSHKRSSQKETVIVT